MYHVIRMTHFGMSACVQVLVLNIMIQYNSVFGERRVVVKPVGISSPQLNLSDSNQSAYMKPWPFFMQL